MKVVNDNNSEITPMGGCVCSTGAVNMKRNGNIAVCACQCSYGTANKKANKKRAADYYKPGWN